MNEYIRLEKLKDDLADWYEMSYGLQTPCSVAIHEDAAEHLVYLMDEHGIPRRLPDSEPLVERRTLKRQIEKEQ